MSASPELDERFADWVDGRLSAAEEKQLERELDADPDLRSMAEGYRSTVGLLRDVLDRDERAPDGLEHAIVEAAVGGPTRRGVWPGWIGLAAAAGWLAYLSMAGDGANEVSHEDVAAGPPESRSDHLASQEPARGPGDVVPVEVEEVGGAVEKPAAGVKRQLESSVRFAEELPPLTGSAAVTDLGSAVQRPAVDEPAGGAERKSGEEPVTELIDALRTEFRNQAVAVTAPSPEEDPIEGYLQKAAKAEATPTSPWRQLVMVLPVAESTRGPGAAPQERARERGFVRDKEAETDLDAALPKILTAPEVMGEATLHNQLGLHVQRVVMIDIAKPTGGGLMLGAGTLSYRPVPGDQIFAIEGTEQDLPLYFSRLQAQLAQRGEKLQMQWVEPAVGAKSRGRLAGENEARGIVLPAPPTKRARTADDQARRDAATRSILLVLRRQSSAGVPSSKTRR